MQPIIDTMNKVLFNKEAQDDYAMSLHKHQCKVKARGFSGKSIEPFPTPNTE
jgi:hypothetical protein